MSPQAAAFARQVVPAAGPGGRERAKNLLWAAARLADYAVPLGLDPVPEVVLHPSVIERFARCAPGLSGVARRTLRTNLRFIARRVVPQLAPADAPLPRERAKAPYSPAEIAGYLALADAQPTLSRRMRARGLVCLGAGAGLIRADLRAVRGTDVACRSGGVIVAVRGARPRAVPVLARYHETFSRPPPRGTSDCADPEASWGHRAGGGPGQDSELFFGYYPSAATMMRDEHGPPVPELARRMTVCSCRHDPARALVPVLTAMPGDGIPLGDILADSGYAHRDAGAWAIPLRQSGAQLVQDLHPLDRGPRGTTAPSSPTATSTARPRPAR